MNSAMGPSFKIRFAFFCTCKSREQCTNPQKKNADALEMRKRTIQTLTNSAQ